MRNLLTIIKNNIYVIAGALCVIVICTLYFTQNGERDDTKLSVETEPVVIFNSEPSEPVTEDNTGKTPDAVGQPAASAPPDQTGQPTASVPQDQTGQPVPSVPPDQTGQSVSPLPAAAEPESIQVYISGEVTAPGVYNVPSGARVWQVLEQAGGFTEQAAEDYINLAAYVSDAQHIVVPSLDDPALSEIVPGTVPSGAAESGGLPSEPAVSGTAASSGNVYSGVSASGSSAADTLVNINTADSTLLQTLPGIGEQIASYIIEYREQSGGFKTIEDILNVPRIGTVTFDRIKDRITIGGM